MSRLVHSEAGYVRSLQISKCQFFAFVEGGMDRPFYERVLQNALADLGIEFHVVSAKELPNKTGGKISLLEWFSKLRKDGALVADFFGKKFVNVIFADKDIDDVLHQKLRSPHLIYTATYDLEGHLFWRGDFNRAISDACGITSGQAKEIFGEPAHWIPKQVENWKQWTALCMASQMLKVNVGCTYDRNSAINPEFIQETDATKLEEFKNSLRTAFAAKGADFDDIFQKMERKISLSLRSDSPLKYFKGKWFRSILQKYAAANVVVPDAQLNGIGDRVVSTLIAQVGLSKTCPLCAHYVKPVHHMAACLA